jgi:hypothetical protein
VTPCFVEIEARMNEILGQEWQELVSDPEAQAYYGSIFERSVEGGFYSDPQRGNVPGQLPASGPNEAYIQSHEKMWEAVDRYLAAVDLKLEGAFRHLFSSSREYEDSETEHRRVFCGQLCNAEGKPLTSFMLTVPHSHERFRYSAPMQIALSKGVLFEPARVRSNQADRTACEHRQR